MIHLKYIIQLSSQFTLATEKIEKIIQKRGQDSVSAYYRNKEIEEFIKNNVIYNL